MWYGEECDGRADVQQLKHRGGDHQVVEVALARLNGEADDAEYVAKYSSKGCYNLELAIRLAKLSFNITL